MYFKPRREVALEYTRKLSSINQFMKRCSLNNGTTGEEAAYDARHTFSLDVLFILYLGGVCKCCTCRDMWM